VLKEEAFLNPKEEDDDPYESSQMTVMIANPSGIFAVYSMREVFEFDRFWAIGSGRSFALGAMYAQYERARSYIVKPVNKDELLAKIAALG
jgi:ATP-dependent protease HslVU (ClpYQ) peptidase subunit